MDREYKEMIKKAIRSRACHEAIKLAKKFNNLEEFLNYEDVETIAYYCCWYAFFILRRRCFVAEKIILKSPVWSYHYVRDILKRRHPEFEKIIKKDPYWWKAYKKKIQINN